MQSKYKSGLVLIIGLLAFFQTQTINSDMETVLVQLIGLILVISSSLLIAIESAKANYLEFIEQKYLYELQQMKAITKSSFKIIFNEDAKRLYSRKKEIKEKIELLKKERLSI